MTVLCSEVALQEDFLEQLEWKYGKIYDALDMLFDISYQPYKDDSVLQYVLTVLVMGCWTGPAGCCSSDISRDGLLFIR